MVFSSPTFLYYFLPITLIAYFLTPMPKGSPRLRNLTLLIASLIFYAWGEPRYVFLMMAQCVAAWGFSLLIEKNRDTKVAKAYMLISVAVSLSGLIYFKYANFFLTNINNVTGSNMQLIRMVMPIGISFYTFQLISYIVDLYRSKIEIQRNLLDFSTYVASFPQLIAGRTAMWQALLKAAYTAGRGLPWVRGDLSSVLAKKCCLRIFLVNWLRFSN
jgi:alginate O-acetyltransferase complex protein AlgI